MVKSLNFVKKFDETNSSKKTSCRTLLCPASFLATGGFNFYLFPNACMVYKHAVVAAFRINAQHSEDVAKRGALRLCVK